MAVYNSNTRHGYTLRLTVIEESTNVNSNTSILSYSLDLIATGYYFQDYSVTGSCTIAGKTVWSYNSKMSLSGINTTKNLAQGTLEVWHAADGNGSYSAKASFYSSYDTHGTGQLTIDSGGTLTHIPRYATVKAVNTWNLQPTWFELRWVTEEVIESWWYSLDAGSTWSTEIPVNGRSAQRRITGLTPNTEYPVVVSVKRRDNGLYTNSAVHRVKTVALSTVTDLANFNIDQTLSLAIAEARNDLIYRIRLKWYNPTSNAWENIYSKNDIVSTSVALALDNVTKQRLRTNCPNSKTFKARVELSTFDKENTYQGLTTTTEVVGTLTGVSPSIGTLSWIGKDTPSTIALLGNLGKIIRQKTPFDIKVSSVKAGEGATLKKVSATALTETVATALSGTTQNNIGLAFNPTDKWHNLDVIVTVTDSRGMTASKTLKIPIQNWDRSVLLVSEANRENGYEATTQFNVEARYWDIAGKNKYYFRYAIKKKEESDYPKKEDGSYLFTDMIYTKTKRSGTDNDWQHVVSSDFVFPSLDSNREYTIWLQYGESLEDWRNHYVEVGRGVGLFEWTETDFKWYVPLTDGATGSKYVTMADLITEKGSNYTKYADGTMKVLMHKDVTITCDKYWDGWYYAEVPNIDFPVPFVGKLPVLDISPSSPIALSKYNYNYSLTGTGIIGFYRPNKGKTITVKLAIKAEGRWK